MTVLQKLFDVGNDSRMEMTKKACVRVCHLFSFIFCWAKFPREYECIAMHAAEGSSNTFRTQPRARLDKLSSAEMSLKMIPFAIVS